MCKLDMKYGEKEFVGYKVVVDKDGRFFSPAMGCQYPLKGKVPIVKKQNRLCLHFRPNILTYAKAKFMYGRTAAFKSLISAESLQKELIDEEIRRLNFGTEDDKERQILNFGNDEENFGNAEEKIQLAIQKLKMQIRVVKVKLTSDLMLGEYGHFTTVVAGKHIEFLEKPQSVIQ
jgi:hypothetical protein